jgi:hypothetical protein
MYGVTYVTSVTILFTTFHVPPKLTMFAHHSTDDPGSQKVISLVTRLHRLHHTF